MGFANVYKRMYVVNVLAKNDVKTLDLVKRLFLKQVCSCKYSLSRMYLYIIKDYMLESY